MSAAVAFDFDLHIEMDGSASIEFESADDLALGTATPGGWIASHECMVIAFPLPRRATRRSTSITSMMTPEDFREIVEVFRVLKRWRDEQGR